MPLKCALPSSYGFFYVFLRFLRLFLRFGFFNTWVQQRMHDVHATRLVLQATQEGLFLGSLSTGERRRVALALTLGYVDLLRARGAAAVDTLVLDEVHANLDREGVRRVLDVVRTLSQRCVVVVGQAGSEVAELADRHEAVVKREDGVVTLERQY